MIATSPRRTPASTGSTGWPGRTAAPPTTSWTPCKGSPVTWSPRRRRVRSGATTVRGSRAFDGDPNTGWVPGRAIDGEWLSASFDKERTLSRVVIEQPEKATGWVSEADIFVDGRRVATTQLTRGRVEVALPPTQATTVRLQVTAHEGEGFPVVSEVDLDGARVSSDSKAAAQRCVTIGTIDDDPVRVRLVGGVDGEDQRLVAGCEPLELGPGEHRLRSLPGWTADSLVLRDSQGEEARAGAPGPGVTVDRRSSSSYRVGAGSADSPYLLVVGQNVNAGWRATMDGEPLGPPVVVDGYAMGWWVRTSTPTCSRSTTPRRDPPTSRWRPRVAPSSSPRGCSSSLDVFVVRRRHRWRRRHRRLWSPGGGSRWRRRGLEWGGWFSSCSGVVCSRAARAGGGRRRGRVERDPGPRAADPASAVRGRHGAGPGGVGARQSLAVGRGSPQLVLANPAPSVLVVLSLVLLVVGSWRDADRDGGPAPGTPTPTRLRLKPRPASRPRLGAPRPS